MTFLTCVASKAEVDTVGIRELGATHGLTERSALIYERFYELRSVLRCRKAHRPMLLDLLQAAVETLPREARHRTDGMVVYCKTQTHNTPAESNWLQSIAIEAGLDGWGSFTFSMTNCASILAALHWAMGMACTSAGEFRPIILIAGEKAFHPSFSRLSVGLLSEQPVAIVLDAHVGDWKIRNSFVRHQPRFYRNPEDMDAADRQVLNDHFHNYFSAFLKDALETDPDFSQSPYHVIPYNLNLPLLRRLSGDFAWNGTLLHGDIRNAGHMYCSDIPANLIDLASSLDEPNTRVFAFAAGMGVTFAALFLERRGASH